MAKRLAMVIEATIIQYIPVFQLYIKSLCAKALMNTVRSTKAAEPLEMTLR